MSGDLSAIRERTQETDTRIRTLRDEIDALRTTISSLPSLISQARAAARRRRRSRRRGPGRAPSVGRASGRDRAPRHRRPAVADAHAPVRQVRLLRRRSFRWRSRASRRCCARSRAVGVGRRSAVLHRRELLRAEQMARGHRRLRAGAAELPHFAHRCPTRIASAGARTRRPARSTRPARSWEAVIKLFPDSDAARLARQDLERDQPHARRAREIGPRREAPSTAS